MYAYMYVYICMHTHIPASTGRPLGQIIPYKLDWSRSSEKGQAYSVQDLLESAERANEG